MHLRRWFQVGTVVGLAFAASANAHASVITGVNDVLLPGFSTGSLGPVGGAANVAPNNDNSAGPSSNTIPSSVFLNAGGFGILDFEFNVENSGGTTEYFHTPLVVNNSGVTWTDFHFLLGFGTGADFVAAGAGTGLDFDMPDADPLPTSSVFTTLVHGASVLEWDGGTVNYLLGPGGPPFSVAFTLSFDVPDNLAALHPQGVNRFTLRSYPTSRAVPEPAALSLIGFGFAAAITRFARRR